MRRRIAALEETIASLPTAPGGPLNDNAIDETKSELAENAAGCACKASDRGGWRAKQISEVRRDGFAASGSG
jgi:hypothetical protein